MRIGAQVFGYSSAREWAGLHAEQGLGAAYWPLGASDAPPEQEAAYIEAAAEAGLVIAEVGVWNNVLEQDADKREANIRYAIERLRTADRVGARCCVNIAGTLSAQWDGPHPGNLEEGTLRQIVKTTQRIIDEAAPTKTFYSLEPMPWMVPYDADSMQWLIDEIDRLAFAVHVDMVNLVNGFEKVYRTGELTKAFFGRFGPQIRSVHAKDVRLMPKLTLHIEEAIPGSGIFDFDTLLTLCEGLGDVPVMTEHLQSAEEYASAVAHLKARCEVLGIVPDVAKAAV